MIGYFIVEGFTGETDSAGFETQIKVSNQMDMNLKGVLFLPPYLRKGQCNISEGDKVFGIVDDTSGLGVAVCGLSNSDFGYFFDANIQIKQKLTVESTITCNADVTANVNPNVPGSGISLANHWHGYIDSKGQPPVATPSKTQASNTIAPEP